MPIRTVRMNHRAGKSVRNFGTSELRNASSRCALRPKPRFEIPEGLFLFPGFDRARSQASNEVHRILSSQPLPNKVGGHHGPGTTKPRGAMHPNAFSPKPGVVDEGQKGIELLRGGCTEVLNREVNRFQIRPHQGLLGQWMLRERYEHLHVPSNKGEILVEITAQSGSTHGVKTRRHRRKPKTLFRVRVHRNPTSIFGSAANGIPGAPPEKHQSEHRRARRHPTSKADARSHRQRPTRRLAVAFDHHVFRVQQRHRHTAPGVPTPPEMPPPA